MKESQNRISACLVVYNEEKKIEACLKSLQGFVDEIVVVHDGPCADSTLSICTKYNCRIFIKNHIGDAEPHRPFALQQCQFDWVLQIDADERLSPELQANLRTLVNNPSIDAYAFNWIATINNKKSKSLKKVVLFRKEKMYAIGLPHIIAETRGVLKYIDFDLTHDTSEFDSPTNLLRKYITKDRKWGIVSASLLWGPIENISVFKCTFPSSETKQSTKLMLMRNHPLIALCIVPLYSFLYGYIRQGGFRYGYLGFVLSCHTPLHAFYTCYFLLKRKFV
ncbi:MAG: glycosyltransferase [bacterium]|nr:glycosyltransferase [bacterium]